MAYAELMRPDAMAAMLLVSLGWAVKWTALLIAAAGAALAALAALASLGQAARSLFLARSNAFWTAIGSLAGKVYSTAASSRSSDEGEAPSDGSAARAG
jgi:hypothetical protein